jgi:hypothetical protein
VHPGVIDWVQQVLTAEHVKGLDVLEVGSYDVNGSVRPYLESLQPRRYLGVDAEMGPSVDRVVDCEKLTTEVAGLWDLVISTEMLEHVRDWQTCIEQLVEKVKPVGLLLITTRSPGFPYHPFPEDHWRFRVEDMTVILGVLGMKIVALEDDPICPGVFVLARKPINWQHPTQHRQVWETLNIAKPTI